MKNDSIIYLFIYFLNLPENSHYMKNTIVVKNTLRELSGQHRAMPLTCSQTREKTLLKHRKEQRKNQHFPSIAYDKSIDESNFLNL